MYAINGVSSHVQRGMETEGEVRAIEIVIDGLGQSHYIQAIFRQQLCGFNRTVAAQHNEGIQFQTVVGAFHQFDFIHSVFIRFGHIFKALTACPQNGAAARQ